MSVAPETAFIGRDTELTKLRTSVRRTLYGAGTVTVIEGEAGIGKSRLLGEALADAIEGRLLLFRGAADELHRDRPFGVIADALGLVPGSQDSQRSELGRLLQGHADAVLSSGGDEPLDLGFTIVDSIASLVESLAATSPLALILEDVHWADIASVSAVMTLAKSFSTIPVALFLTRRPYPRFAELDLVIDRIVAGGGLHLGLRPMKGPDIARLANDFLGVEPSPRLLAQLQKAGGNPLFVIELLRAIRDEAADLEDEPGATIERQPTVPSLSSTVLRRLTLLSDEALDVLRIASVLGSSFSPRDLATVLGRPLVELLRIVTGAVDAGFLQENGELLAFRHEVLRESIYKELPVGVRKELHRHVGMTLAGAGIPPAQIARHLSIGASRGDTAVISLLHAAAREIAPQSAAVAVDLLERAWLLSEPPFEETASVAADLARALYVLGRISEAEEVVRAVSPQDADPNARVMLGRMLAMILFFGGNRERARDLLDERARVEDAPASDRATDLALAALASPFLGDLDGAQTRALEAQVMAQTAASEMAMTISLVALCFVARYRGRLDEALDLARRGVETARNVKWGVWEGLFVDSRYVLAATSLEAGRLDDARTGFTSGRRSKEELGNLWQAALNAVGLAVTDFVAGDWEAALSAAEDSLSIAASAEKDWSVAVLPRAVIAVIAIHRGELEAAASSLDQAEEILRTNGPQLGAGAVIWAKGLLAEARGEKDLALMTLREGWALYGHFGYVQDFYGYRSVGPDVVRVALAAGDTSFARSVVGDLQRLATRDTIRASDAAFLRARGLLDSDANTLLQAAQAYRASGRSAEAAFATEEVGVVWRDQEHIAEAVPALEEALQAYEHLDARRDTARVDAALRSCGVRRSRRSSGQRPTTGWQSLTETELRVVDLVKNGLTNRQIGERLFISRRTAETHVGHALRKLSLSTRVELAAAAAARKSSSGTP